MFCYVIAEYFIFCEYSTYVFLCGQRSNKAIKCIPMIYYRGNILMLQYIQQKVQS